jgi:hypothetical protein
MAAVLTGSSAWAATLPALDVTLGRARVTTQDDALSVTTGPLTRFWKLTEHGLRTTALRSTHGALPPLSTDTTVGADWEAKGWIDSTTPAELVSLTARESTDADFTSRHLEVIAEFNYPAARTALRYVIWAYPGADGLRTQLWMKNTAASPAATGQEPTKHNAHTTPSHRTDWLPVAPAQLRAIGYYNDTQNRHMPDTHLLREESVPPGVTDWANILCSESTIPGAANVALVKESHKCANQTGVDTGAFIANESGFALTGFGVSRSEVRSTEWRWAWANWIIAYPSAATSAALADQRELALKKFQRMRYPVRADLDLYTKANTWGSGRTGEESMARASESEVLAEIDSVAELGLDELQIDDGWQTGRMKPRQPAEREWIVRPDWYPNGWTNVVARAAEKHIKLGIWHAARAPLDALQHNHVTGGFKTWKLDFANLSDYSGVHSYLDKGRAFIEYTHHQVRVNWDVTEIAPRFGYFWASECGNLWLANRKPMQPASVVPKPWLMLREGREIARYLNLNKIELPIQNFAMVNTNVSDAHLHSTTYATALGLAGIPVFFQTTRLLTPEQRAETKALLDLYKQHRAAMFNAYVFPMGDEPDNQSWSGFQWFAPANPGEGYLLIFRERLNTEAEHQMALRFLHPGSKLVLQDLRSGRRTSVTLDDQRAAPLSIADPGGVAFMQFTVE